MKRVALVACVLAAAVVGAVVARAAVFDDPPAIVVVHWSNSHPMREGLLPEMAERVQRRATTRQRRASRSRSSCRVVRLGQCRPTTSSPGSHGIRPASAGCTAGGEAAPATPPSSPRSRPTGSSTSTTGAGSAGRRPRRCHRPDRRDLARHRHLPRDGRVPRLAGRRASATPTSSRCAPIPTGGRLPRLRTHRVGTPAAAGVHQPEHVDERSQRARVALLDRRRQAARRAHRRRHRTARGHPVREGLPAARRPLPAGHDPAQHEDRPGPPVRALLPDARGQPRQPGPRARSRRSARTGRPSRRRHRPRDDLPEGGLGPQLEPGRHRRRAVGHGRATPTRPTSGSTSCATTSSSSASWTPASGRRPAPVSVDPSSSRRGASTPASRAPRIDPARSSPTSSSRSSTRGGRSRSRRSSRSSSTPRGRWTAQPIEQVKDGLTRLLDAIAAPASRGRENQVGLVTFSIRRRRRSPRHRSSDIRFDDRRRHRRDERRRRHRAVRRHRRAIALTDAAAGDPRATRAVVVLSDGAATAGGCLDARLDDVHATRTR